MGWKEQQEWHALTTDTVLESLESDAVNGLDEVEVARRFTIAGPNIVEGKAAVSPYIRFLLQFHNPLVYILLAAAALTATMPHNLAEVLVILSVVLVNAVVGYIQEARAQGAIDALSKLVRVTSRVLREAELVQIDSSQLVPGDIVQLASGDRVPADLRLLRVKELQINESTLTGESVPSQKRTEPLEEGTGLADRKNMAYSGTLVTYGQGFGVVVATSNATELGRISHLINTAVQLETPLTRKLSAFSIKLTKAIILFGLLTFGFGIIQGHQPAEMFLAVVAMTVAVIPEGLPAAVTIILALGVTKMARRKAVIRRLPAVEATGSITVICSDKTGTLTRNEMTAVALVASRTSYGVTGTGYAPEGTLQKDGVDTSVRDSKALRELITCGLLCNEARLVEKDGHWEVEGDPTEGALGTLGFKVEPRARAFISETVLIDTIPFESERQYMATLHELPGDGGRRIFIKGSVERVLGLCNSEMDSEGTLDQIDPDWWRNQAEEMASKGLRVLVCASSYADSDQEELDHSHLKTGLMLLGLVGMIDPPREEAIEAIKDCHRAGIKVKMITGDHPLTARAIAEACGLSRDGESLQVMTGVEVKATSNEELPRLADEVAVFARVAPEQKLSLVRALQASGHIVAMTGDGVNDAPALKQADVGIAMGLYGTEAAREASDAILTDDNFATIAAAIEEGRGVYENLRKFITWTLATNGGEGLITAVAVVLGLSQLPILPVQVLWINMSTAVLLGMTLAFEPKEPGLMSRPPRSPKEPILNTQLLFRTLLVSVMMLVLSYLLFWWEGLNGLSLDARRSATVNTIVFIQTMYLFNCRSLCALPQKVGLFSNPWTWLGVLLMVGAQIAVTQLPALQAVFKMGSMPLAVWGHVTVAAFLAFIVIEVEKAIRRRRDLCQL